MVGLEGDKATEWEDREWASFPHDLQSFAHRLTLRSCQNATAGSSCFAALSTLEPQTDKYQQWNHREKYNTWERAVKSLRACFVQARSLKPSHEIKAVSTSSPRVIGHPSVCPPAKREGITPLLQSAERVAFILTAPYTPAPSLNMRDSYRWAVPFLSS